MVQKIGKRYGCLVVIEKKNKRYHPPQQFINAISIAEISTASLVSGATTSCGYKNKE